MLDLHLLLFQTVHNLRQRSRLHMIRGQSHQLRVLSAQKPFRLYELTMIGKELDEPVIRVASTHQDDMSSVPWSCTSSSVLFQHVQLSLPRCYSLNVILPQVKRQFPHLGNTFFPLVLIIGIAMVLCRAGLIVTIILIMSQLGQRQRTQALLAFGFV